MLKKQQNYQFIIDNMNEYTIPCTKEQACKAQKLGAPIRVTINWSLDSNCKLVNNGVDGFVLPTAEEMICWLETTIFEEINIQRFANFWEYNVYLTDDDLISHNGHYKSRTEATLAAIDAALEYLTNKK